MRGRASIYFNVSIYIILLRIHATDKKYDA